jgi:hypothetical protein
LTETQRHMLSEWLRGWKLERADEEAFLNAVERSVRLYVQMKPLAEETSAKVVRRNLKAAAATAAKLVVQVNRLDGNSDQLIENLTSGGSVLPGAEEIHRILQAASKLADDMFSRSGRRPEHERDALAAQLADALEMHTSATPTATRAMIFEDLLCRAFELLGKNYVDLHTLAERVLERRLLTRPSAGIVEISTYETPPARRQ